MPLTPAGLIAAIAAPTLSVAGAVYVGAVGAVRSMASARSTSAGAVNPVLAADTPTTTLAPVMYTASAGTLTDQVAVPLSSAEVALNVAVPTCTVTETPASDPVFPPIANPSAFSAMLMVSSPAIVPTFSVSAPTGFTVTVSVSVASS